ncbi:MAG: hypothetical protein KIS29_10780 [Thermoplasmata archaeon]|nr:hypothetical protein [Candidatus Sysuiplasma jiujiangense]
MSRRRIAIRHPGSLSKYGFDLSEPEKEQMTAIRKADRKYGKGETNRKLAALETFNRHHPAKRKRLQKLIKNNGGK